MPLIVTEFVKMARDANGVVLQAPDTKGMKVHPPLAISGGVVSTADLANEMVEVFADGEDCLVTFNGDAPASGGSTSYVMKTGDRLFFKGQSGQPVKAKNTA